MGFLVLGLVISAFRTQRATRSLVVGSVAALLMVGFQAYLGKVTVEMTNSAETVTAHLATAMVLLAIFLFLTVRSRYPAALSPRTSLAAHHAADRASRRSPSMRCCCSAPRSPAWAWVARTAAPRSSTPTGRCSMAAVLPTFDTNATVAALQMAHFAHRIVAAIVAVILAVTTIVVWRAARSTPRRSVPGAESMLGLVGTAATLFAIQVIVGAAPDLDRRWRPGRCRSTWRSARPSGGCW